ncbi:hypothetical protein PCH_Pc21g15120 [Penicillium rubens Wisconsin 54-1255]|uniref:Uncharacterized protein n=1 Tax=Penicillium rubens (strain ATCC 28089 / DSM 1075 / NRRL 1951 / Wisconsin 54-1255) TaxID=500485 RepID=B6HJ25_PENRW|nr:hypothetical protein PCH_Pc21g15120 [Penicillium rubens Wisconsin 54-1255]
MTCEATSATKIVDPGFPRIEVPPKRSLNPWIRGHIDTAPGILPKPSGNSLISFKLTTENQALFTVGNFCESTYDLILPYIISSLTCSPVALRPELALGASVRILPHLRAEGTTWPTFMANLNDDVEQWLGDTWVSNIPAVQVRRIYLSDPELCTDSSRRPSKHSTGAR